MSMADKKPQAESEVKLMDRSNTECWTSPAAIVVCALVAVIVGVFWKTVFLGDPISKLGLLEQADTLINPSVKLVDFFCVYDPSLYELCIPVQIVIERIWLSGNLPLWNPFNGCGYPMIGDIQSFVFSPFRFLFSPSRIQLYNFSLVLQVVFGGLCMFALSRLLSVSPISSSLAALSYCLCPGLLRNMELPNHVFFVPGFFLAFVWLAKSPTVNRSIFAGAVCALAILSMHPETALYITGFASLLCMLLIVARDDVGDSKLRKLGSAVVAIAITGVVAFCLAAPVLFPFYEYMSHSQCYKHVAYFFVKDYQMSIQAILLNFLHPAFDVFSPYPGVVASLLIPISLIWHTPVTRCIGILMALSIFFVSSMDQISRFLPVEIFDWFIAIYALPVVVLTAALLAGFGLDQLFAGSKAEIEKKHIVLVCLVLIVGVSPPVLVILKSYWFPALLRWGYVRGMGEHLDIDINLLWFNAVVLAVVLLLILFLRPQESKKKLISGSLIFVALNCISQAPIVRKTLPIMPRMDFVEIQPIEFLRKQNARILTDLPP